MSKKCNHCYDPCSSYNNGDFYNSYLWIIIIGVLFSSGNFWSGYRNAFSSSTFNCDTISNSSNGDINNFFGNNYYN